MNLPQERGGRFYRELAVGGHVGRPDLALPWEQLDALDAIRAAAGSARAAYRLPRPTWRTRWPGSGRRCWQA